LLLKENEKMLQGFFLPQKNSSSRDLFFWDFLINPYTFFNKSRTILRVKAKAIVRVRAKTQLRVKARGQPLTEGARKS